MSETIFLRGENPITNERTANAAITPGHLIELMSTDKVRVHATAGGNVAPVMFAVEDDLQGNGIDDAYAATDRVKYIVPRAGDEINAILANGQTAAIGSLLESAGDGTLRVYTADVADSTATTIYPRAIVGVAQEALDLSGSSGADPASSRIRTQIV